VESASRVYQRLFNRSISLLAEMLPSDRLKKEWNKSLRHSDPRIAFEAFKLANAYLFGKPVQPVNGEELAPPIRIGIGAIPMKRERA
jgi:hypothetical protein